MQSIATYILFLILSFKLENFKEHLKFSNFLIKMKALKKLLTVCFLFLLSSASAEIRLPQLISDGMVLQRDVPITIWGWAGPGEKITIKFKGKNYRVTASGDGLWKTVLMPASSGGPYSMILKGKNTITIKDILIGDVWFCSGQSNMVLPMERVKERYPNEIDSANYPEIRNFFIPTVSDIAKVHDDLPPANWVAANTHTVLEFGAASYFFAKQLYKKYHIPIGIINSSVGGTPIQAWISEDGLKEIPQYAGRVARFKDTAYLRSISHPQVVQSNTDNKPVKVLDKGLNGPKKWYDTTYVAEGWHSFWLPGYWADQGVKGLNGVVWFRKEINLPASVAGKKAKLFMGRIIDADQTYVNGVLVGNINYQYPPRRYEIPANLLKPGKNIIIVRLTTTSGNGGFVFDKPYFLAVDDQRIDLRGDWQYKVGQVFDPHQNVTVNSFSAQNEPTGLYNTMIAPTINYSIKGVLWYQGETNAGKPGEYHELLTALIADWRNKWHTPDLPFIYAQLPNFMEVQYSPAESQWAELREAQLKALHLPNTGMAVTIDAGEWNDVHPLDKKDVGDRLALAAEQVAYGEKTIVSSGPVYQSAKIEGTKIVITFTNIGGGLIAKGGGELTQFAIAGADKKFVWANAVIEGDKVIVSNDDIANPLYVRYAWADNPDGANLYNKEGLPASPFRNDDGK